MTDAPALIEHVLREVTRESFNRYRKTTVTQYKFVCSCTNYRPKWRESLDKAIIDRDSHAISGQLSIFIP